MKDFIKILYEMDLHANECNPPTKSSPQENTLYNDLMEKLPKEHQENFLDFMERHQKRTDYECESYFKKGFRYAVRFILECFNENF